MKILLFEGGGRVRQILGNVLEKTRHHFSHVTWEDMPEPDLEQYDMVMVDGNVCGCADQERLLQWVRIARARYPALTVLVLSFLETSASSNAGIPGRASHTCGIVESANGLWESRCRLKEIALGETAALLRDANERPLLDPVVFEYSGRGRS